MGKCSKEMGKANKGACGGKRCVLKRRQKKWMRLWNIRGE